VVNLKQVICNYCNIRKIEEWEVMCSICKQKGSEDEKDISKEMDAYAWDDFPNEDD
jgi:hypothetical protein